MPEKKRMITVEALSKEFVVTVGKKGFGGAVKNLFHPEKKRIRALSDISFSVDKGEVLGFLGPNGAGKSTTVKILTGILTPTGGSVQVGDLVPYRKPRQNARQIGVVFGQRSRLWWNLPVQDSFEYTKALYSIPDSVFDENIRYFSENFGVGDLMTKPVRTLSLGQKMRAEITMAMLHNPEILYLDEPTIGLDVVGKNELHSLVGRINRDRNVTVLLVTHDVLDIERLCTRVIIIDKGRLIWQGNVDALKRAKGNEKHFHIVFGEPRQAIKSEHLEPVSIAGDGLRHEYRCNSDGIEIESLISLFFSAGKVIDINVTDAPLDHVMRRIYTE
ncbi:MAG: ATP-binding cassette domain-containing protein [Oscillospiraceae bacterium]|nr:ATP-binding cassette domain-containing protein [Oscillospiraceae bacterium]